MTVSGILAGKTIVALARGGCHSLALCSDGTLAGWGYNLSRQIVNDITSYCTVPVEIPLTGALAGRRVVAIAAGSFNSMALCADGTVAVWGSGGGATGGVPVAISNTGVLSGKSVTAIAAGTGHCLAQCADGTVAAWGGNSYGQLGNNSQSNSDVPMAVNRTGVLAGKTVTAIAGGGLSSLALCSDGTLATWGDNDYGELGNNSTTYGAVPVAVIRTGVLAGKTVAGIAAGANHYLVLCSDSTLAAWGNNSSGQLGNNNSSSSQVPVAVIRTGVLAGKIVTAIAAGASHCLAVCSDGTAAAWGNNSVGQLGDGTTTNSLVPLDITRSGVLAGKTVVAVSAGAGSSHSLALCADGTVDAWGDNSGRQLGNNSSTSSNVPVEVSRAGVLNNRNVVAVAAGTYHNVVLCADGTVAAWGGNSYGVLGNGGTTTSQVPVAVVTTGVLAGKSVVSVAAGYYLSLAGCSDGTLAAWGNNTYGQLGNNSTVSSNVPVLVDQSGLNTDQRLVGTVGCYQHCIALAASPWLPVVATLSATDIAATSVTLSGSINARGESSAVAFEYGPTSDYGSSVDATPSPVTGTTQVTAALSGLLPATTYHYRVRATNSGGTATGADMTFTTPSDNANLIEYAFGLALPVAGA